MTATPTVIEVETPNGHPVTIRHTRMSDTDVKWTLRARDDHAMYALTRYTLHRLYATPDEATYAAELYSVALAPALRNLRDAQAALQAVVDTYEQLDPNAPGTKYRLGVDVLDTTPLPEGFTRATT